jgi:hypothetical protein
MPDSGSRHPRSQGARRRAALYALATSLALWQMPSFAAEPSLPPGMSAPAKPTAMPAFDLPLTAGGNLRSESLRGQVTVIRFWASW